MKRLLFTVIVAVIGQIALKAAGLTLQYPTGGESLPMNGKHSVTWTNSDNLPIRVYLDWYETNGTLFVSNGIVYSNTFPAGTNSYILDQPNYPGEFQYKIRLDAWTNNLTSSSGFVRFTDSANFTVTMTNQAQWLPNQTRHITVSWSGFQSNDSYSLVLESPPLQLEGYGFLITNFVMGASNGTQTFSVPYPSTTIPAYPPFSYPVTDGTHQFALLNQRCGIVTSFGSVDMVTAGLRMYVGPSSKNYIIRGDSGVVGSIYLDATLATNNVQVSNVTVVFTSYSTNRISLKTVLMDGASSLFTNVLDFNPTTNSQYSTQESFPVAITVQSGSVKELKLECTVLYDSGLGDFIWNTGVDSNAMASVAATYAGSPITSKVIPSFGGYINILEVINPKFIGTSGQSNSVTFRVFCKPSTTYEVQASSNLLTWTTILSTNSLTDMLQVVIPTTNSHYFFRLKEN